MTPRRSFAFVIVLTVLVATGAIGFFQQWKQTANLRNELEAARENRREQARLRVENERLRSSQIPAAELERLRADHAALPRLRSELEALKRAAK